MPALKMLLPGITVILSAPISSNCPATTFSRPCPKEIIDTTAAIPITMPIIVSHVLTLRYLKFLKEYEK